MKKELTGLRRSLYRISKPLFFMVILVFSILLNDSMAKAASMTITYDGNTVKYSNTQVSYTLDGTKLNTAYPGIILNGISLAPCTDVFVNSGMGITYKYSKAKGLLYLYHGSDTIKFTLGSTTATVNGKNVKLSLAPRIIGFPDKETSKVYVPARFVAENFGFTYTWTASTGVAAIQSPGLMIRYNSKDYAYSGKKISFHCEDTVAGSQSYPGLVLDKTVMAPAKLTYASTAVGATYKYDSASKRVTIKKYGNTITMTLGSKTATVNGEKVKLSAAPRKVKLYSTGKTVIYVPAQAVAEAIGFEYLYFASQELVNLKAPHAIYYNGSWSYPSVRGSVTFNGKEVDVAPMYSYLENDVAMLSAKRVFKNAAGCGYQYDSAAKTLELTNGENTVLFTIGSTTAYVNGVKKEMTVPARSVKNGVNNTNYIMVPGRFAATSLGFNYEWLSAGSTSVITSEDTGSNGGNNNNNGGNSGGNGGSSEIPSVGEEDKELFRWEASQAFSSYLQEIQALPDLGIQLAGRTQTEGSTAYTSLVSIEQGTEMGQNYFDTYYIQSSDGFFGISGGVDGRELVLTLSETVFTDQVYTFSGGLVTQAHAVFDAEKMSTTVRFTLAAEASTGYSVSLTDDYKTAIVKIYRTCLTGVSAVRKNGSDILTFSGTAPLAANVISDNGDTILIQVDGMLDTLEASSWTDSESGGIQNMIRIPSGLAQTQFLIQKKAGCDYYLMASGNEVKFTVTDTSDMAYSLKIPYMPGTDVEEIVDEDDYRNKRFVITLPGDQLSYLDSDPIINTNNQITGINKSLDAEGNTAIIITTSKLQAYKIHYGSGALLLEVDTPKNLFDKIVVLDAGHGGTDPGTQHGGYNEKDLNFEMIYTRMKEYFKGSDVKAYWTREDDTLISLNDRAAYASKVGADLFISLHMNSFTTSTPNGLSVYYATQNNKANSGGLTSKKLADILQYNLINGLGANDRKVKTNTYVVCKNNTVPAVLIELGFMSNPSELKKLVSSSYQQKTAKLIYDSVVQVFEEYPTGR